MVYAYIFSHENLCYIFNSLIFRSRIVYRNCNRIPNLAVAQTHTPHSPLGPRTVSPVPPLLCPRPVPPRLASPRPRRRAVSTEPPLSRGGSPSRRVTTRICANDLKRPEAPGPAAAGGGSRASQLTNDGPGPSHAAATVRFRRRATRYRLGMAALARRPRRGRAAGVNPTHQRPAGGGPGAQSVCSARHEMRPAAARGSQRQA